MPEIRRIGTYLETDADGYLTRPLDSSRPTGVWSEMVEAATAECVESWRDDLHSVYVRGSVANGCAIEGVSDVDVIMVVRGDELDREAASAWSRETESRLEHRFSVAQGFELVCMSERDVLTHGTPDSVVVKLECVCVHGDDLVPRIPPYRPGPDIALQIRHFGGGLDVFRDEYPDESPEDKMATMAWLMRRFLRAGMELVMVEERRFTRDLYLCYESFAKHYPEKGREMYRVLELAINPAVNAPNEEFIRSFGEWLRVHSERKLVDWENSPSR